MATVSITDKGLSEATKMLRETVLAEAQAYNERWVLAAESFRQTEGEPFRIIRTAKANIHIFSRMPIKIRPGEILVGWHPNSHPDGKTKAAIAQAQAYLRSQNYHVPASEGHMGLDYPAILGCGLDAVRKKAARLASACDPTDPATPSKKAFYNAAELSLGAFQDLIRRYARLAREMSESCDDPDWAEELTGISEVCDHIASEPARNFRDAVQLMWFMFLGVAVENGQSHHCFGPGRIDQYLLPYYQAEKEAGILDEDLVDELIDQLFVKCNEFQGPGMSAVIIVVGGRKPDGTDATNELSYKMLEASDRVRMYFPGADISWHSDMDPEFVLAACRLLRNGKGQPAFFNSDVIVKGLMRYGIPFEHAVDHLPSTCTETSIMGRTNPWVAWPYMNLPMCLLYALFDGKHPLKGSQDRPATGLPRSYWEVREAFLKNLEISAREAVAKGLRDQLVASWYRPFPLLSCFIQDCLDSGRDISHGGARYNFLQPEAVGVSNVVDGLAAIKTLVEDKKRYTLDEFRAAIVANFEGHEDLLKAIRKDCPKHGQDVDWVNDLFAEVAGGWCSGIEGNKNQFGGPILPGFLGWTVWIRYGEETPATPDGRKAGEPLAHSLAPCSGVRSKGFPAVVLSASKFDHSRGLGGITFNIRFGANSLANEEGPRRLKGLIEGAFDIGCYQVQINLASAEVMREAQKNPTEHSDLFVRIGGYLVPFTLLPKQAQEDVIARTQLEI